MPFGSYRSLADALRTLQVVETQETFLERASLPVSDHFRSDLEFTLRSFDVTCSEAAICEMLLFPVLRETLKPHMEVLSLWSHVPLYRGDEMLGVPDYVIGKHSALAQRVMERPFALIMEAKKNDFDAGWAQCLAAMDAVQALNGDPQQVVYGIVSDGFIWRFGKLRQRIFAHNERLYLLQDLDELFAALNHLMELCKQQILAAATAA